MTKKHQCPKTVIYYRSIKSCSVIYKLFTDTLKDNAYSGIQYANDRLSAMYHYSTSSKCKKNVMEEFPKLDSKLRVISCISAFGLGVNVPDIDMIINWGAPTSVKKCMQEFMRGRRDGRSSNPENCPFWVNIWAFEAGIWEGWGRGNRKTFCGKRMIVVKWELREPNL